MTPNLIGITGNAGHGKGSVANVLREHGYTVLSFATPVKEMLIKINPLIQMDEHDVKELWKGETPFHYGVRLSVLIAHYGSLDVVKNKYPDVRQLLQRLETDAGKTVLGNGIWAKRGCQKAGSLIGRGVKVCFDDVRFPESEGEEILGRHGVIWRVTRYNDDGSRYDNGIGLDHPSESQVQYFVPDAEIRNDGSLGDLRTKVETLLGVGVEAV